MGPSSNYTLELRGVWLEFFGALPDGSRVLDIGTGNGAVVLLAKDAAVAGGKTFDIHGSDLAQIDPVRHVRNGVNLYAGIEFHPGTPTERLPFESGRFDAVSGQFALEYAGIDAALREIHRVLRSGGCAQFILHHEQSVIAGNARASIEQSRLVLDDTQILRKLRRHLELERRSATAARASWKELNDAAARLQVAANDPVTAHTLNVTLDAVRKMLDARRQLTPATLDREIGRFEQDLRAATRRLHDVVDSSRSADQMESIAATARDIGFLDPHYQPQFHATSNLVGWRFSLAKRE